MNKNYLSRSGFFIPVLLIISGFCAIAVPWKATSATNGLTPGCIVNTWTATSTTNAPSARQWHAAVWTGSELIVWGGFGDAGDLGTGGRYNPSTDSWTATSTTNAPSGRSIFTAVWTGSEMIVWGGQGGAETGGRYNPSTDSWIATSTTNAPTGRYGHTAVWTGSEMIVWGGNDFDNNSLNTGGRYNPSTDTWTATSTTNAPTGRTGHTAVWTGSQMIVWGGDSNTGGRYDPSTDSWVATTTNNVPVSRSGHTAVWTGDEMIIWGGIPNSNTGGRYNPGTDSWTATSTTNAPTGRYHPAAVWTGSEMIVWGGWDGSSYVDTGARYHPGTDAWTPTSTIQAPTGRFDLHTAIWTGSQMIVWGNSGGDGFTPVNTGGRYCAEPSTTPTPPPGLSISGSILYCSNPVPGPVPNVILLLTGTSSSSTLSDGSGNYLLSAQAGGSYVVTPSKTALTPTSSSINTLDAMAAQGHYLNIAPLTGCQLAAADVNGDTAITNVDVIAIQRFFIGRTFGIGNAGKYQFSPTSRPYPGLVSDQTGQNYDALVFGDVVHPIATPTPNNFMVPTNSGDPLLLRAIAADGRIIDFLGTRDANGIPASLTSIEIRPASNIGSANPIRYLLDSNHRPVRFYNSDGTRFDFTWVTATSAAVSVRTPDGQTQVNTFVDFGLASPHPAPGRTSILVPKISSMIVPNTAPRGGQHVILRQGASSSVAAGYNTAVLPDLSSSVTVHVTSCGGLGPSNADVYVNVYDTDFNFLGSFPASDSAGGNYVANLPSGLAHTLNIGEICSNLASILGTTCDWLGSNPGAPQNLCTAVAAAVASSGIGAVAAAQILGACEAAAVALELYCHTLGAGQPGGDTLLEVICRSPALDRTFTSDITLVPLAIALPTNITGIGVTVPGNGPFPNLSVDLGVHTNIRSLTLNPPNPVAGQSYAAIAEVSCLPAGTVVTLSIVGTDGYTDSVSTTINPGQQSGNFSLLVPGAEPGVIDVDTVTVVSPNGQQVTLSASLVFR